MIDEIFKVKVLIPYWDNASTKPTEYSPYRIIEVHSSMRLSTFGEFILHSFEFENDHPFGFYENIKRYYSSKNGFVMKYDDDNEWLSFDSDNTFGDLYKSSVSELLTRRGKKWLFLFDYGDEWNFWVTLVDKYEQQEGVEYPRIKETHMKPPLQYDEDDTLFE